MQDGVLPHNAQIVTDYLSSLYPNKWIGNMDRIRWPTRLPHLFVICNVWRVILTALGLSLLIVHPPKIIVTS